MTNKTPMGEGERTVITCPVCNGFPFVHGDCDECHGAGFIAAHPPESAKRDEIDEALDWMVDELDASLRPSGSGEGTLRGLVGQFENAVRQHAGKLNLPEGRHRDRVDERYHEAKRALLAALARPVEPQETWPNGQPKIDVECPHCDATLSLKQNHEGEWALRVSSGPVEREPVADPVALLEAESRHMDAKGQDTLARAFDAAAAFLRLRLPNLEGPAPAAPRSYDRRGPVGTNWSKLAAPPQEDAGERKEVEG